MTEEDCTCPVCCDIFRDPAVLLCGHSFCKNCLLEWWRQSGLKTCPVCKQMFPMRREPPRNLALKNLSDTLRQVKQSKERSQREGGADLCGLHSEKLKLFCLDDQQPICVVCRDAKQHKKHSCIPMNEAAEEHQKKLEIALMHLKSNLEAFKSQKVNCDKMAAHIKLQARQTEKSVKEEFQKLYQFLRAEEATRIDALRNEVMVKSQTMQIRITNLATQISSLTDAVKDVEEKMQANDISFMLNVKSTIERAQCTLPEPETPPGALINEAQHLGNLLFTVWEKMKRIVQYTPVILDPNTLDSRATTSECLTRVTKCERAQQLPANPERNGCWVRTVLGSEGFSSGRHSWEVEVQGYWAVEDYTKLIFENSVLKKIQVQLDYDQGKLSFFDGERNTHMSVGIVM
ncbi:zinc-binding protein A33-like [Diretmus argenteus]